MISWRCQESKGVDVTPKETPAVDLDLYTGERKNIFIEKVAYVLSSRL